jgi:hypothetical protein
VAIGAGEGWSVAWARPLASERLWKRSELCKSRLYGRRTLAFGSWSKKDFWRVDMSSNGRCGGRRGEARSRRVKKWSHWLKLHSLTLSRGATKLGGDACEQRQLHSQKMSRSFSMFRFWTSTTRRDPRPLDLRAWSFSKRQGANIHGSQTAKCLQRAHHVCPSTRQREITLPTTKCASRAPKNRPHSLHYYHAHDRQINLQTCRHYSQGREAEPVKATSTEYSRA